MKLRPYQLDAVESALGQLAKHRTTLGVMPTGCGKTVVFAHVIERFSGRCLVLAHTEELVAQAADKIARVTGHPVEIEMADRRARHDGFFRSKVVVASKDSLHAGRLARFSKGEFSLIVVDEAHRSVAKSYTNILKHFADAKVFGVTATPDRRDEVGLKSVFESVAFTHDIREMIRDGWLVPLTQKRVDVRGLDLSSARITAGDLNQGDIAASIAPDKVLRQIVDATVREAGKRRTLVFAPPGYAKDHEYHVATRMAELFDAYSPGSSRRVSQDTAREERRRIVSDFAAGKFQFLVNVGVFTEGFDDPGVECVAVARPTTSRALYAQMVGRGTRPLPAVVDGLESAGDRVAAVRASAKPKLLVIDFAGNAGRHTLVNLGDILGGREPGLAKRVRDRMESGGGGDPIEIEDEERELLAADVKREQVKRAEIIAKAVYTSVEVSPWEVVGLPEPEARISTAPRPPTDKQAALLEKLGAPVPRTMQEATDLLSALFDRRDRGLCGYALARALKAKGLNPDVTNQEARAWLDDIRKATTRQTPVGTFLFGSTSKTPSSGPRSSGSVPRSVLSSS